MWRFILAVDPGMSGAVVVMDGINSIKTMARFDNQDPLEVLDEVIQALTAPYTLRQWLEERPWEPIKVFLELVHAMPGQGVSSMFNFGVSYGALQGWFKARRLPVWKVSPQTWQKLLPPLEAPKERVRAQVEKDIGLERFIFPGCRVPHQGAMDAYCLAHYGVMLDLDLVSEPEPRAPRKKRQPIRL